MYKVLYTDSLYEVDGSCCVPIAQSMQNAECPSVSNAAKVRSIKKCQSKSTLESTVVVVARLLVPR